MRFTGGVSDALRNLMMQHADIPTFLKYYLPRRVTLDAQAIVRGLEPQEELISAALQDEPMDRAGKAVKLMMEQSLLVK